MGDSARPGCGGWEGLGRGDRPPFPPAWRPWAALGWCVTGGKPRRDQGGLRRGLQLRPPCWPGRRLFPEHRLSRRTFTPAGRAGPEAGRKVPRAPAGAAGGVDAAGAPRCRGEGERTARGVGTEATTPGHEGRPPRMVQRSGRASPCWPWRSGGAGRPRKLKRWRRPTSLRGTPEAGATDREAR